MRNSYKVVLQIDSYLDFDDYVVKFQVDNAKNITEVFDWVRLTIKNIEKELGLVVDIKIEFDYSVEE
jgi:hypothetical protein